MMIERNNQLSLTRQCQYRRLLEPIGNIPPAEFEMAYYRQIKESADAA